MAAVKEIRGEEFRRLQLIELDMALELDRVCRKNDIKYSIYAGTMLGAVRHKGFIPWDDDIDIAMLREDYERFKAVADELDPGICFFQDHETDPEYRWGYAKLRRTGTEFIRAGQEHIKCQTGVCIDIFPMDDVPRHVAGQMLQNFLRKILWSGVGKYSDRSFFKRCWFGLLSHICPDTVFRWCKKMERKSRNDSVNRIRCLLFPIVEKQYAKNPLRSRYGMPKQWFTDLEEYDFEGYRLLGTKDFEAALKFYYGDWRTEKPEEPHSSVSHYDFNGLHKDLGEDGGTESC